MKNRGSTILGALFLIAILLVLGLAALTKSVSRQRTLSERRDYARAQFIAEAGLADVQSKLDLDLQFPPPALAADQLFSYTEEMRGLDDSIQGYYTVTIDGRYADAYGVYRIRSVGLVGANVDEPIAEARIEGDIDVSPVIRGTTTPNPDLFNFQTRKE